ncbi:MAG: CotH kinase family protein [Planctomycetes bacterium]|nr:CotH kinase family protein [Planctomycetota bacterium]
MRSIHVVLPLSLACSLSLGAPLGAQGVEFIRGDSNSSGRVDISDAIATLACLFSGGACPSCLDAADANDDGAVDLSDAVYTLSHLFAGGPAPAEPFPEPGFDPTAVDGNTCGDEPGAEPGSVVISEIHYHPVSGDPKDEFIELHNRGSRRASLEGWTFTKGVEYTFGDVAIEPGAYLVVAYDPEAIAAKYGIANVVGGYGGTLDDGGETIRLKDASGVTMDEVHYDDGGLWPRWADGYGSSLELIDLHGENDAPAAWAASDEAPKAEWTAFTITGAAAAGSSELHVLLLSQGECLVDDLKVLVSNQNRLSNGSFENGMTGWLAQGTHRTSGVTTAAAVEGTRSLRLVATGRGDTASNRIECELTSAVSGGQTVSIRGSARWVRGARFLLLRLHGNAVAQSVVLKVPADGGTPGGPSSVARPNRGPDMGGVSHAPVLPSSTSTVKVTATIADSDGVASAKVSYRVEPAATVTDVAMNDAGQSGDAVLGDTVYTATLPRQQSGKMVAFWITAEDGLGQAATFPAEAPKLTCLYRVGEPNPSSQLERYHVWMPAATVQGLGSAPKMSNEMFDITFVLNNTDVFYNAKLRYRGSPFIRSGPPTDPVGGRYAYRIDFGEHQPSNGESEINLDNLEPGRDPTLQRERAAYEMCKAIGLPYSEMRYVRLWFNGNDHGVYADVQKIDKSYVKVYFPDDEGGRLHKIDDYFEFDDNFGFSNRDARLANYGAKKEEYRWNFEKRDTDRDDDFSPVQALVQKMNATGTSYEASVESAIDPEQWARTFAIRKIIGDWDSFGYARGKNMYMYRPPVEGRWKLLNWDMDFLLGNGAGPSEPLFGGIDDAVNRFLAYPKYKKLYLKAFRDLVDGPFSNAYMDPVLDETYALLRAHTSVADPSSIKSYIAQRRTYVLSQLPSAALVILTNGGNDFSTSASSVTIEGDAPLEVERFRLNGASITMTITGISKWSFTRSIPLGTTVFGVQGLDGAGQVVGSDSISVLRVVPCVPEGLEPSAVAPSVVTLTIRGSGFQTGTTPAVRLASASTEGGFAAYYAQRSSPYGDIDDAEGFLRNPAGAVRTLSTTHATVSRRTEGGGEIFPTTPFPSPWNAGSVNNLAARYTGYIHVPSAGSRTFGVNSDDGFRLRLNGAVVAEYPPPRGPGVTTGAYGFPAAGSYPIELTWYENGGGDIVQLFQESAGGVRKLLNDGSELTVTLDDPVVVTGTSVQVVDSQTITAAFDLTAAPPGPWTLEITPAQGSVCRLVDGLTVE